MLFLRPLVKVTATRHQKRSRVSAMLFLRPFARRVGNRGRWLPAAAQGQPGCTTLPPGAAEGCLSGRGNRTTRIIARATIGFCFSLVACTAAAEEPLANTAAVEFFEQQVRPLLVSRCYKCHAVDSKQIGGGLLLDSRDGWQRGGDSGPAIIPGNTDASLLLRAVRWSSDELQMPPDGRLKAAEIAVLETWIRAGAPDPRANDAVAANRPGLDLAAGQKFWAFQPPPHDPPAVPEVANILWPQNPIDHFILAELEPRGMSPSPLADKRTLIRRATFDLLGLPPTPEEVAAFLADDSPTAYPALVDRLLASPHYGERWGRYWLNVARYADSNGLDENIAHGNAWRYRDYVVRAFNADKPYSDFVREQLAGDLLPPVSNADEQQERLIATGFLSLGPKVLAEVDETKMEMDIIDEQVETVGRAFMALTLGCARCHDHKFDPIPTSDYYALAGIFKSTKTMEHFTKIARWNETSIESPAQRAVREAQEQRVAAKKAEIQMVLAKAQATHDPAAASTQAGKDNLRVAADSNQGAGESQLDQATQSELAKLRQQLNLLESSLPEIPTAMAVADYPQPVNLRIHVRGNHLTQTDEVPRHFPTVLCDRGHAVPLGDSGSGRRELAEWLVDGHHPLTARVLVNRLWDWHFGRGLVQSPDNFGRLGSTPSHPALLDWLAQRFVNDRWSLKSLHRLIMLSATYQQTSRPDRDNAALDPDNQFLSRANGRRLDAESIRDALLAVSGRLDPTPGGSLLHVKNREFLFDHTSKDSTKYDSRRRSIYLPVIRNHLYDGFQLFDYTNASSMHSHRPTTVVAPQALFLMNSELLLDAARDFADRVCGKTTDPARQVAWAYEIAYARPPSDFERAACLHYLQQFRAGATTAAISPGATDPASDSSTTNGSLTAADESAPVAITNDDRESPERSALAVLCHALLMSNEFLHVQ